MIYGDSALCSGQMARRHGNGRAEARGLIASLLGYVLDARKPPLSGRRFMDGFWAAEQLMSASLNTFVYDEIKLALDRVPDRGTGNGLLGVHWSRLDPAELSGTRRGRLATEAVSTR